MSVNKSTGNVRGFYNTEYLNKLGKNAKEISKDPVRGKLSHIKEEINTLMLGHREFIFQLLLEKFGPVTASELMQNQLVKEKINNFNDLTERDIKDLSKDVGSRPGTDVNAILRGGGVFAKPKDPEAVKQAFISSLPESVPNLLKGGKSGS